MGALRRGRAQRPQRQWPRGPAQGRRLLRRFVSRGAAGARQRVPLARDHTARAVRRVGRTRGHAQRLVSRQTARPPPAAMAATH